MAFSPFWLVVAVKMWAAFLPNWFFCHVNVCGKKRDVKQPDVREAVRRYKLCLNQTPCASLPIYILQCFIASFKTTFGFSFAVPVKKKCHFKLEIRPTSLIWL